MHFNDDKLHEECGVVGIYSENESASKLAYYGLLALQHRGQESAGIATNMESKIQCYKGMGLVQEVFDGQDFDKLKGDIAIGHVRYSTTGDSELHNAQPLVVNYKKGAISLAHNGNLVNAVELREILEEHGVVFQTSIDTEVIVNLLARYSEKGIVDAIQKVVAILKGAYAIVLTTEHKLVGIRDPHGLRPLCLGKIDGGYVLASESCALNTIGAELIRDIEPGEIIIIENGEITSIKSEKWCKKSLCIFELIYFARPDSTIDGTSVYSARYEAGRILAKENPVEADLVISVPDSGTPAAIGYSYESKIPYGIGLIKNRYVGRTFIQPTQKLREQGVMIKLSALKENVEGKRIVIIDDSIVRGTTSKRIVDILKKAGAKEVHVRISSPPVAYSCYFGIDTPYREYLVAANNTLEEVREMIGADSLAYISTEGLLKSTQKQKGFCCACFDGEYPMEVPVESSNGKRD